MTARQGVRVGAECGFGVVSVAGAKVLYVRSADEAPRSQKTFSLSVSMPVRTRVEWG